MKVPIPIDVIKDDKLAAKIEKYVCDNSDSDIIKIKKILQAA